MNKRDTIIVVFRVVAIFILFSLLANVPNAVAIMMSMDEIAPVSVSFKLLRIFLATCLPFGISFLLWNKSGWIADKVLKPLGMDELWEDLKEDEILQEEHTEIIEPEIIRGSTITHLNREEIESIVLTAIGVWVIASSMPEFLRFLFTVFASDHLSVEAIISHGIISVTKSLIGGWLLLRSNHLIVWLKRWRNYRMED